MSIAIQENFIAPTKVDSQEIDIEEIQFTATDLNEATNVLRVSQDDLTKVLENNAVYKFVISCGEFTPDIGTKIFFSDYDEIIENAFIYYNSIKNSYRIFILHEDDVNEPTADVTKIINAVGASGDNGIPIDISTSEEMDALLISSNVGKAYKYTGATTADYTNGDIYIVEEE